VSFHVYIVASHRNGTIYIGMTDDLHRRISEHKTKAIRGFTSRYGCDKLVWFEEYASRDAAFSPRTPNQGMAAELEAPVDRGKQPDLGGLV
jgi:predicted GIY-YIG superfamily endonuclease